MAASSGREYPVDQDTPKLIVCLRRLTDSCDEEILELGRVTSVEAESKKICRVVDLGGQRCARARIGVIVRPVAEMRPPTGCGDGIRTTDDAAFEDGALAVSTLDAKPAIGLLRRCWTGARD